mgnify:CR=1 FL=1
MSKSEKVKTTAELLSKMQTAKEGDICECEQMQKREELLMSVIEKMKDSLDLIAEEQRFYIKDKDYFSEVVRLNLTAKETLEEIFKIMEGL